MNRLGRMEGLKDNAVATRDFPEKTFVRLTLQRLYQAVKRIVGKLPNIIQNSVATVGRDRLKLFCGVAVNVYEPSHTRVGPGGYPSPLASRGALLQSGRFLGG